MAEKIEIKKKKFMMPVWLKGKDEDLEKLVEQMYSQLDETFPVVTGTDHHHYRKERNLRPWIARWMFKVHKKAKKKYEKS
jgi:23S rRNA maturation-related 3'-5' exoribonuclease YhaM